MHDAESRPQWIAPLRPRSPDEAHRSATPLELFFDLVFVVAIARAASALHHGVAEAHAVEALVSYCMAFFGVWWAWMNFTWFSTSYDNGDVLSRVLVFVQMTGALILAVGVEPLFAHRDFTLTVIGYVVIRIGFVSMWLRAARDDPEHRPADLRYAGGVALIQVGWVLMLFLPPQLQLPAFVVGVIIELLIPIWAELATPTPWHAHHVRERYGLFTIIVLGESILSASVAIESITAEGTLDGGLIGIIVGSLLIVYAMWWLYFYQPADYLLRSLREAFGWSYGHVLVFGSTAAVGAGLAVVIDQATHHAEISATEAGMAVALPVAIYVISLWLLHERPRAKNLFDKLVHPVAVILILLTPFTGQAVPLIGILLLALVAVRLIRHLESNEPLEPQATDLTATPETD